MSTKNESDQEFGCVNGRRWTSRVSLGSDTQLDAKRISFLVQMRKGSSGRPGEFIQNATLRAKNTVVSQKTGTLLLCKVLCL